MSGLGRRIGAARPTLQLPASRSKRIIMLFAILLVTVSTGVGGALGGSALVESLAATAPMRTMPPAPQWVPQPDLLPATAEGPDPTPAGVAAVLDPLVNGANLGTLSARVVDPATGTVLWERGAQRPLVPASTVKLVTASAALLTLDHQETLRTTVVAGSEPGTVVLVGGGDPTLSAASDPSETVYPDSARLGDLVEQVRGASSEPVRRVLVDVGRYTGEAQAPGWANAQLVEGGYVAPIVPVMLDGGRRTDAGEAVAPRATQPATAAAAELARRLGADPDAVAVGPAPPGAAVLGEVSSPPVADLVATLLDSSDNVLAEVLTREVAVARNAEPSFAGATAAVLDVLAEHGFDVTGTTLVDGSGLSVHNAVPASLLTDLLAAAAAPVPAAPVSAEPALPPDPALGRTTALRPLLVGLPIAGGSGTLTDRYAGATREGRGWVRAKTGTLTAANSLAGTVLDGQGRVLVFAVLSNGPPPAEVRPRLDALAAALRSCGCR